MKSVLRSKSKFPVLVLGWILLLVGVIGLFLPLLPGIPLLIAGLVILSREYEWARQLLARARQLLPRAAARLGQFWRRVRVRSS